MQTLDPAEIVGLYRDQFWPLTKIAAHFRCDRKRIWKLLKDSGVAMRRPGTIPKAFHPRRATGVHIDKHEYILLYRPDHPHCNSGGYVREHRLVMEQKLGRILDPKEVVHHKDGDHGNNDPDNLELFDRNADHLAHELAGRVPNWTEDGKKRMADGWTKAGELMRQLQENGRPAHWKNPSPNPVDWPPTETVIGWYNSGVSCAAIAALCKCSRGGVERFLSKHKVQLRAPGRKGKPPILWPDRSTLEQWRKEGLTLAAIADRIGASKAQVFVVFRRLGLDTTKLDRLGIRPPLEPSPTDHDPQQDDAQASK